MSSVKNGKETAMAPFIKDRRGYFGVRRLERSGETDGGDERRELERARRELAEAQKQLEADRAEFEEDLAVLEQQRRFLDNQREKIRQETLALESRREELSRSLAQTTQRARVEAAIDDARRSLETERRKLQSELAVLLQHDKPRP